MWSPDRRRAVAVLAAVGASLALGGCFRPLYGELSNGRSMAGELAAIQVDDIGDRLGHYLRNELIFLLDGSGQTAVKRYRLAVTPSVSVITAIVDSATARADSASLSGTATFVLTRLDNGQEIFRGTTRGSATYDRSVQRYATVRAARDAEIRLGKLFAEQIRTQIAAALAGRSS
ncbi:MAG: hypothetical protein BGP06_09545 [Rhizobiales bacterium 65-9]|nr:hypothetical protein [Hyphomicrobiales bacterium]OJY34591.1 MAG: hypothetical protein BGP06_09545 [Rhizobiales bacterium 65-9]